jgi:hypothetical protein
VFETAIAISTYLNFVNNDKLLIGISGANFSNFHVGNFGSFSFSLNGMVHLNEQWSVVSELELLQSGIAGLTATFYGFAWRGGVRVLW